MKIIYIAPEIPGLSSTFVYKEIFEIEKAGNQVIPVSIHQSMESPPSDELLQLKTRALHAYRRGLIRLGKDNLATLVQQPVNYTTTLLKAAGDAARYLSKPKIALGILYRFWVAGSLTRELSSSKPEHIHAHFGHFPTDIAMYCAMLLRIPFSFTVHANDIYCNEWLLPQKCHRSKFVASISEYNRKLLRDMGCDEEKIHIVRCGVDMNVLSPPNTHCGGESKRIGFVGRAVEKKGIDTLLRAFAIVQQTCPDTRLEIIGDGPLLPAMKALCQQLNLGEHIEFRGNQSNEEIIRWLQELDAFVLPCKRDKQGDMDGIPVALMEAMICRIPVISTRITGIPELVINNVTGLIAEPDDHHDLANLITQLLRDEQLGKSLTDRALEHLSHDFDIARNAAKLNQLFSRQPST